MTDTGASIERLTAWLVRLPLRRPFMSATTQIRERRVILVKVEANGREGWGEAAPVPGHSGDDVDRLWAQLLARGHAYGPALLDSTTGMIRAAIEEATADLNAQVMAQPLWRLLGSRSRVTAGAAIGVTGNGDPDRDQIDEAVTEGYRHVKLKVTPRTTVAAVATLLTEYPGLEFGADGNGTLTADDPHLLQDLDALGLAYIEQPGPDDALALHARLRKNMQTPICLDETATSKHRIREIVATAAADVVNLKVGRFGTATTLRLADELVSAGIKIRLGGLIETGIGRSHSIALGGHEFFSVPGDLAGSERYFDTDLVHPAWKVINGTVTAPESSGIGVEVDETAVDAHSETTLRLV